MKEVDEWRHHALCVLVSAVKLLNDMADFREIRYGHCAAGGHLISVLIYNW
jgi:hypothetical protein